MSWLFAMAALAMQPPLPAVGDTPIQTGAQALDQDSAAFAQIEKLDPAEARSRLAAIEESVPTTEAIAARFAGRLAGISLVEAPSLSIRVLLTGDAPVAGETFTAKDGRVVPIAYVTGASATRRQLVQAIYAHQAELHRMLPQERGVGVDQRRGELRLFIAGEIGDAAAIERQASAIAGVPVRVSRTDARVFDFAVTGGGRVIGAVGSQRFACTTGFIVTDGRRQAVTTAAHCPDELSYYAPDGGIEPLPYIGAWGARAYDVQLNGLVSIARPLVATDPAGGAARPVTGWRGRDAIRAGEPLCHVGQKSGYACASVELTDFAPPGDLCAGPCEPLFITIAGPACGPGDSGGPVFVGTEAVAVIKGGSYSGPDNRCNFSFVQSVDYLPPGWRLEVAPSATPRVQGTRKLRVELPRRGRRVASARTRPTARDSLPRKP
ncbi:hypothetical protein ABDK56_04460 [Sphingomonas sp. ASV193]|uniref:hypothetical protein n=1 Tax=Sphingomonas sp. ASV193 TaxID=3144405 RepID=UPI0032E8B7C6